MSTPMTTVMAGIPATNLSLYRALRFKVGDPAALLTIPTASGRDERLLIIRDIEVDRAKKHARADSVFVRPTSSLRVDCRVIAKPPRRSRLRGA